MIVRVRRSGGFANIARTFTIDSSHLDPAAARDLENSVDALRDATADRNPDGFRYHVSVDGEEFTIGESWIAQTLMRIAGDR